MKAFWCVRGAELVDGAWQPSFPVGFEWLAYQVYGDLRVFGPDAAPGDHKHVQLSCLALGTNHYHWLFWNAAGDGFHQDYVGGGAGAHTHVISADPTHFFVFVICTDAMYTFLLAELPNIIITGHAETTDEDSGSTTIGDIDSAAWDAGTRTGWETLFAAFGQDLPEKVTNDRRLCRFVLTAYFASGQNIRDDKNYRYRTIG